MNNHPTLIESLRRLEERYRGQRRDLIEEHFEEEKRISFERKFGEHLTPYRRRHKQIGLTISFLIGLFLSLALYASGARNILVFNGLRPHFKDGFVGNWNNLVEVFIRIYSGELNSLFYIFHLLFCIFVPVFVIMRLFSVFFPKSREEKRLWGEFDTPETRVDELSYGAD